MLHRYILVFLAIISISFTPVQHIYLVRKGEIKIKLPINNNWDVIYSNKLNGAFNDKKFTFNFSIPIQSFHGFNTDQERDFFMQSLKASSFPVATFEGKLSEPIKSNIREYSFQSRGKLSVHGVTMERKINGKVTFFKGMLYINAKFYISPSDFRIKTNDYTASKPVVIEINAELEKK